jgi:hypothetical protein
VHARQALLEWSSAVLSRGQLVSLEQVSAAMRDEQLDGEIERLNACLYGRASGSWDGSALLTVVKRLREQIRVEGKNQEDILSLYPEAA